MPVRTTSDSAIERYAQVCEYMGELDRRLGPVQEVVIKVQTVLGGKEDLEEQYRDNRDYFNIVCRLPLADFIECHDFAPDPVIRQPVVGSLRQFTKPHFPVEITIDSKLAGGGWMQREFVKIWEYFKNWGGDSIKQIVIDTMHGSPYSFEAAYYKDPHKRDTPFIMGLVWHGPPSVDKWDIKEFRPGETKYWMTHS